MRFLREINAADDIAYVLLFSCESELTLRNSTQNLLRRENGDTAGSPEPVLRSGLYIVRSSVFSSEEQAYVVYWPEDTTWDDHAASSVKRNRVTFMRYTQLSQDVYH